MSIRIDCVLVLFGHLFGRYGHFGHFHYFGSNCRPTICNNFPPMSHQILMVLSIFSLVFYQKWPLFAIFWSEMAKNTSWPFLIVTMSLLLLKSGIRILFGPLKQQNMVYGVFLHLWACKHRNAHIPYILYSCYRQLQSFS